MKYFANKFCFDMHTDRSNFEFVSAKTVRKIKN